MPAEEHGNAASEDVEPCLLLLCHHQASFSEPDFPVALAAASLVCLGLLEVRSCHGESVTAEIGGG